MKKIKSLLTFSLSLFSISFAFGCDFRHKEESVPIDEDNTCVVTWQNDNGEILSQEVYEKGDYPNYKLAEPQKESSSTDTYSFIGWTPQVDQVFANTTYTAQYEIIAGSTFVYRLDSSGDFYRLLRYTPSENETSVTIESEYNGKKVKVIDNYALRGCKNISSITIANGIEEINDYAFQNTAISSITLPDSVKKIGTNIFKDCRNLSSITFPSGIDNIPERTFYNCDSLSSINIPSTVTKIGSKAFYNCGHLNDVTIPDSVTTIENKAFYQCEKLSDVNVNASTSLLNSIESYAFSETGLTSFTLPIKVDKISDYSFANCTNLESFYISNSRTDEVTVGESAFEGCFDLATFSIPNTNISNIGKRAFKDCKVLTSFSFGENTNTIEDSVFQNCQSLVNLSFSNSDALSRIGNKAFYNTAISSLTIPQNVNYIGGQAFASCSKLKNVIFPGENINFPEGISSSFENCPNYTSTYIDPGKTNISSSNISNASTLTNISIPNNVESITSSAFNSCTNLIYNDYPKTSSGYVGHYLGNSSNPYLALISMEIKTSGVYASINENCKVIADKAFSNITTPFNITFNSYIRNLGVSTFADSAVRRVFFTNNASLSEFKSNVFANSTLESITLPKDIGEIPSSAFIGCDNLSTIYIDNDKTSSYEVIDNSLIVKDNALLVAAKNYAFTSSNTDVDYSSIKVIAADAFHSRYTNSTLNIPGSVEVIKRWAFRDCTSITRTTFGIDTISNLKTLESGAFPSLDFNIATAREIRFNNTIDKWLSLDVQGSLAIPNAGGSGGTTYYFKNKDNNNLAYQTIAYIKDATKIPQYAFAGARQLTTVYASLNKLESIGAYAFYNSSSLKNFYMEKNGVSGEVEALTNIDVRAFSNCSSLQNFTTITANGALNTFCQLNSLKTLGAYAFYECGNLTTEYCFNNISTLGNNAFYNVNMSTLYLIIKNNTTFNSLNGIVLSTFNKLKNLYLFFENTSCKVTIPSSCFSSENRPVNVRIAYATSINGDGKFTFTVIPPSGFTITNNTSSSNAILTYFIKYGDTPDYTQASNYWTYDESGGVVDYSQS